MAHADDLPFADFGTLLSVDDRTSLSGLTDSEVQAWTVARAVEYRQFALALLSVHNSVALINRRLPNEILSHVFAYSWRDRKSVRLAHVCRRWRQVLLATPEFWVDAVAAEVFYGDGHHCDPPAYMEAILRRSEPLSVQLASDGFNEDLAGTLRLDFQRIAVLTINLESTYEAADLHRMLCQGLPALRKLIVTYELAGCHCDEYIGCDYLNSRLEVEAIPDDALPCLTHAELPAFMAPKVAVSSLLYLYLERDPEPEHDNPEFRIDDLLSTLARCPRLLVLEIINVLYLTDFPTISPETHAITLSALDRLSVKDRPYSVTALLTYVHFPPSTVVRIDSECDLETGPIDPHSEPGLGYWVRGRLLAAVIDIDCVVITMSSITAKLQCFASGRERLYVVTNWYKFVDFQGLAGALISGGLVTELSCTSSTSRQELPLFPLLRSWTNITSLTLSSLDTDKALEILRIPEESTADARVVCPCLERLTLHFISPPSRSSYAYQQQCAEEDIRLAVIALASRSAQIEAVLGPRASRFHTRLTHLTFDESCENVNTEQSRVVHPETSAEVESALRTLEDLVNGPVIFDGLKIPVQLF